MTSPNLYLKQMYCYFRMGLVTGMVEISELIAWADEQILLDPTPGPELIELSLSARRTHSQLLYLLNSYQGAPEYDLPLRLLFKRAEDWLAADPTRLVHILQGLRLLDAEAFLPPAARSGIRRLDESLAAYRLGLLEPADLHARLIQFLGANR